MPPETVDFEDPRPVSGYDARLLLRLLPYVRPHRALLAGSVALVLAITLLDLSLPLLLRHAIDRFIVPGEAGTPAPEPAAALQGLSLTAAGFALLVFLQFLCSFAQSVLMEATGQRIMHDLRLRLFAHTQELSLDFFARNPVGRIVTRLTGDIQNLYELFTSFLSFLAKDLILIVGIAVVLLALDAKLALVTFLVLPAVAVAAVHFSRRAREIFRTLRIQAAEINTRFAETIGGIRVIHIHRGESRNAERFARLNRENYLTGMEQIRLLAVFLPLIEVLALAAVALVIGYGGSRIPAGALSLGALVAYLSYIRMFFRPLRDLAEKYNVLQNALASVERIFLLFDTPPALRDPPPGAAPRLARIEELSFEEVGFAYVPGEPVLKGVSFTLRRGGTLAVVGPTGAGKSSLLQLIPRLYDPTSGRILLNGVDLRAWPKAAFRERLALVLQDPMLFSGTLRENLFHGLPPPTPAEEARIVAAARLDRLLERLPAGLDSRLGEGGGAVSAGERQLIAIARALARNPDVILFDEATSAVDSETEQAIQEALARLLAERTAILVAHRLSTVRAADEILVLHRGRILEAGPHAALMARRGFYFHLHQAQAQAGGVPAS